MKSYNSENDYKIISITDKDGFPKTGEPHSDFDGVDVYIYHLHAGSSAILIPLDDSAKGIRTSIVESFNIYSDRQSQLVTIVTMNTIYTLSKIDKQEG